MLLGYFIWLMVAVLSACNAAQYGRKRNRVRTRCNRYDPEPFPLGSIGKLAGKRWHAIYAKPDSEIDERTLITDEIFEYFGRRPGSSSKITISHRLGSNPEICTITQSDFFPVQGREGLEWQFICDAWGPSILVKPYMFLYVEEHFLVTWECFKRNRNGRCIDFFSVVFRDQRDINIPPATLHRISQVVREKACLDFHRDYVPEDIRGKEICRRFSPFETRKYPYY